MRLPNDDDDLGGDDRFEDNDREALYPTKPNRNPPTNVNPAVDCCVTGVAFVQFLWIFRRFECLLVVILLISISLAVTGVIESYESKKHNMKKHQFKHEYADLQSALEMKLGDIDHWCLDGKDDSCPQCDDPTHPISRGEYDGWKQAFMRNVKLSNDFVKNQKSPDVIFLGDSLVEATVGTFKGLPSMAGTPAAKELSSIKEHYDSKFSKVYGGKYDALRLGIAGDSSPNLFWRIRQDEMRNLSPKVWWVSIGRNDLFRTKCSEEVALMGVLRVVEELAAKNDGATIVINSLLPTSNKINLQLEGGFSHNDMWLSIQEVNTRLKKFASKHHHVVFYDADDVFVETRYKKKYISKELYVDKVHPSFEGYKALVANQLQFLDALMQKREKAGDNRSQPKGGESKATTQAKLDEDDDYNRSNDDDDDYLRSNDDNDIITTPGQEYLNYDDYYGYISEFAQGDDFLNDFSLYNDDDAVGGYNDDDW
jgi:lysophospholipase L1-like esterase